MRIQDSDTHWTLDALLGIPDMYINPWMLSNTTKWHSYFFKSAAHHKSHYAYIEFCISLRLFLSPAGYLSTDGQWGCGVSHDKRGHWPYSQVLPELSNEPHIIPCEDISRKDSGFGFQHKISLGFCFVRKCNKCLIPKHWRSMEINDSLAVHWLVN